MDLKQQPSIRRRKRLSRRVVFILAALAAISLIILDRSGVTAIQSARLTLVDMMAPVAETLAAPVYFVRNVLQNVQHLAELRTENESLRQKVAAYAENQKLIASLKSENTVLRQQLNFVVTDSFGFITAPVIADGAGAFVRSVIVRAGRDDGVRKGQAVVTGDGLIGRVEDVGSSATRVVLLEDLNSRIPVMLQSTRVRAILAGTNTGLPALLYLPEQASLSVGDVVITSGDGGAFPQGLPVGVVKSIRGKQRPAVQLFADSDRLDFVRIVDYGLTGILDDFQKK